MPRVALPHLPTMHGFTFPIVRKIIDTMPLPQALLHIPSPFQEQLTGTLAWTLANVAVQVVYSGSRKVRLSEREAELLRKHGGPELARVNELIARTSERIQANIQDIVKLDREVYAVSDDPSIRIPGTVVARGLGGAKVRWRYDMHSKEHVDSVRSRIRRAERQERALDRRMADLRKRRGDIENAIRESTGYKGDRRREASVDMDGNFSRALRYQEGGVPHLLRNTDYDWWVKFTNRFKAEVAEQALRAPHKAALRDPIVLKKIESNADKSRTWDVAASEYLALEGSVWGRKVISPKAVVRMRGLLRKEDEGSIEWLKAHGWERNYFVSFYERQVKKSGGRFSRKAVSVSENDDLRLNELCWCLTRDASDAYPFRPLASAQSSREEVEAHMRSWWDKVEAAGRNSRKAT